MRALVMAGVCALGACVAPTEHRCADDGDCDGRVGGRCEPTGYCSFTDVAGCVRGYPAPGPLAGACVVDGEDDGDSDGVADAIDNCPDLANADQHDEDADQRGDACDNCPVSAVPSQANVDGDELGDACDPRSGGAPNRLVLFDPLTPASAAAWTTFSGLAFEGDDLVVSPSQAVGYRRYEVPAGVDPGAVIFTSQFDVTQLGASAAFGVAAPFTATGLVGCAIANTTPASLVLVDIDGGMVAQTDLARFAGPLGVGSAVVAYWPGGSGGSGACGAALGMDQTEGVFMAPRPANQQAGVFAQDVDARVRYLYAYTP